VAAAFNFASLKPDLVRRMDGALEVLHKELTGLRTGRASTNLLEPVMVSAYGSLMPMNQVGTIGAPEPRMLTVQVWDKGLVKAVEKAIHESNLGLNPSADGNLVRVPIPPLSEERRVELTKIAKGYAEEARVAVRNVRRHGMDELKKAEKDHQISTDQHKDFEKQIQALTDGHTKKIDEALANKEKEILQV
jgi:ribosome recycling factor